ncbi:MAG: hypothetical protein CTY14_05340 [Methylotenera sp.]|nr:MAG: hypothetical protein CTY14_05340 [Methylotenera sp.]
MLRERTKNGLDAARQEGRIGGQRSKLTPQQQKEIITLVTSGQKNRRRLCSVISGTSINAGAITR